MIASTRYSITFLIAIFLVIPGVGRTAEICLDSLDSFRTERESGLFESAESPFNDEFKATFAGLSYFDGDESFRIDATFDLLDDSKTIEFPTFDGGTIPFRKFGIFRFRLDGTTRSLTAHQRMDLPEKDRQWLLIMFRDLTN